MEALFDLDLDFNGGPPSRISDDDAIRMSEGKLWTEPAVTESLLGR